MLSSLLGRLLRIFITSIICSLPIYLTKFITLTDGGILLISFILFIALTGIDAYHFSFAFWKTEDYYLGQLLPLVIYIGMGFLTCLLFKPFIFNRIFLPLRFAGCFGMSTVPSIAVVAIIILAMVTVVRFYGARSGYMLYIMSREDDEDIEAY